jgi:hypothetical protein
MNWKGFGSGHRLIEIKSRYLSRQTEKKSTKFCHHSWCKNQDSNPTPAKYESLPLPPSQPVWWCVIYISPPPLSRYSTSEHGASVKRFVSLQCLKTKTVGRTPWTGDRHIARPLPIQTQTSMPCVGFEPTIPAFQRAKTLYSAYNIAELTSHLK